MLPSSSGMQASRSFFSSSETEPMGRILEIPPDCGEQVSRRSVPVPSARKHASRRETHSELDLNREELELLANLGGDGLSARRVGGEGDVRGRDESSLTADNGSKDERGELGSGWWVMRRSVGIIRKR